MGNITYNFNSKEGIFYATLVNEITINDVLKHYQVIAEQSKITNNLRVLIDTKNYNFLIKASELSITKNIVIKAIQQFETLKEAIVIQNSYAVAIGILFKKQIKFPNYRFKIFSDEQTAKMWL